MTPRLTGLLLRIYPRLWRKRFGPEFLMLLEDTPSRLCAVVDIVRSALIEHIIPTQGDTMEQRTRLIGFITERPSAYLPLLMSFAALLIIGAGPFLFHDRHATDEGPTAHLWQMLMVGQVPLIAYSAIRWLPRATGQTLRFLALQVGAILANVAVVFALGLG